MPRYPLLLVAALLLAAGCQTATTAATPRSAPPPGPSPRPTGPACTAANLPSAATLVLRNGMAGTSVFMLRVRNVGRSRCTLDGYPGLLSTDPAGHPHTVPANQGTLVEGQENGQRPATIEPGEAATVTVTSSLSCGGGANPVTYQGIVLTFADKQMTVPGLVLSTTCPVRVGSWYRTPPETTGG